jgi:hypothetical protein
MSTSAVNDEVTPLFELDGTPFRVAATDGTDQPTELASGTRIRLRPHQPPEAPARPSRARAHPQRQTNHRQPLAPRLRGVTTPYRAGDASGNHPEGEAENNAPKPRTR